MTFIDKNTFATHDRFAIQSWNYPRDRNFHSLIDYVNWLVAQRSRLLTIRLDLSFLSDTRGQYDAEYARDCFKRLLDNGRNGPLFEHLIGYIWAMEFGQERGFHYHLILCFDGHERQQDLSIGHVIGQYWHDFITEGCGFYHNCNEDIQDLLYLQYPVGIGMVHRNSPEEVENMAAMATYLIKQPEDDEPNIRAVLPESQKRFRTFGKGRMY